MIDTEMMFAWEGERSRGSWGEVPIASLHGDELLSDVPGYRVTLRWPRERDLDPRDLLRARAAIRLRSRGLTKIVHGEITGAGGAIQEERCEVVMRPLFARAQRRSARRTFTGRTLAEIVADVLGVLGVEPADHVEPDDGSSLFIAAMMKIAWRAQDRSGLDDKLDEAQGDETDLAFVRRVLDAAGYAFSVEDGRDTSLLVVAERGVGRGAPVVLRDADLARVQLGAHLGDDDEEVVTARIEGAFAGLSAGSIVTLDLGRASARGDYVINAITTHGGERAPLAFEASCTRISAAPSRRARPLPAPPAAHASRVFERNLHVSTGLNKVEMIGVNSAIAIGSNEDVEIGGKQTITVGDGRDEAIAGDLDQKIGGRVDQDLGAIARVVRGDAWSATRGATTETFAGPRTSVFLSGSEELLFGDDRRLDAGPRFTLQASSDVSATLGAALSVFIGLRANVSSSIDVAVFGSLSLRTGATASIELVEGPVIQRAAGPSVAVAPVHLVAAGITILS